jgi:peptide/nickel transport system substrate-binding protein
VPVIEYNPQEALRILHSLGWLDTDRDGILDKNKKPLKIEMLVISGSSASTQFAPLFQAELKKIGVQLDIVPLDFATFTQRVLAGNYQCGYLNWNLDPDPDPFPLFHSSQFPPHGQNLVFYANPEADRLMEEGRREFEQAKRKLIYRQLHALLAADQPYTWTVQVSSKWAVNKRIRDVKESKGWGLFLWFPGELGWWIPLDQRTHDASPVVWRPDVLRHHARRFRSGALRSGRPDRLLHRNAHDASVAGGFGCHPPRASSRSTSSCAVSLLAARSADA